MEVFRVRLNCIDHYQATPTKYDPQLRNDTRPSQLSKEPKVPVIRVFGSTETGQKVCAHIHGAFPYLYIEYQGSLAPEQVGSYIYRLHLSIDHALAVSYRRDVYREQPRFVARITLVKGVPFYGFHVGYRFFLKIYVFNPVVMTRLADLLQEGVIMQRRFQPHEAHLQYLLQFMTDYNLYGCDYLETGRSKVSFRHPVPEYEDEDGLGFPHTWHSQSVPRNQITEDFSLPRASHCPIEVDICVQDILNREAVKERRLHHNFVERLQPIPPDVKLVHSMAGLWKDEAKRRKRRMRDVAPGSSPFATEALVSMSADPRWSQPPGWIHEEEYREQLSQLIGEENATNKSAALTFENYVDQSPYEASIKTTLQSVEDLYPENLMSSLGLSQGFIPDDQHPASSVDVDEQGILGINRDQDNGDAFPDDSDEELLREAEVDDREAEINGNGPKPTPENIAEADASDAATLNGPVGDIGSSTGLKGLPRGVCDSGLKTGTVPHLPIYGRLMEAAREEGLVSRIPQNNQEAEEASRPASKRPRSPLKETPPAKRQKVVQIRTPSQDTLAEGRASERGEHRKPGGQLIGLEQHAEVSSPTTPGKLSAVGDTTRKTGNHKLNFAVVKDPNDPSTRLRLSQQSNSQRSEDDVKKTVPFEPSRPFSDHASSKDGFGASLSRSSSPTNGHIRNLHDTFTTLTAGRSYTWWMIGPAPPSADEVCATMRDNHLPDVIYQDAFYSNEKDVPSRTREYAGREFRLESNTLPFLPDFDATGKSAATFGLKQELPVDRSSLELQYEQKRCDCTIRSWQIADPPPTYDEVQEWHAESQRRIEAKKTSTSPSAVPPATQVVKPWLSQIEGATPKNKHGFKYSQKMRTTSVEHEAQYMSTMSLEVHVNTRGKLVPNPEEDEVQCIFWCTKSDENLNNSQAGKGVLAGIIVLSEDGSIARRIRSQTSVEVMEESTELGVMVRMVEIVRTHDPDILTGYEVHGSSWGYLIERARLKYDYSLCDEFSRMKTQSHGRFGKEADRWGFNTTSTIRVTGRHMINIWRAMRGELNLLQYTMENVVWHLLHRRIPHYSWRTLTEWFKNGRHRDLAKVLRYYLTRTRLDIDILEENELIPRTSEQARLLGVDFFSVFSRGSQFKVESIMFRIAKPENFMLVSPSRKQVGAQNALECLPLVMEPQSAFYNSPLLVLDFQSLYPSVMIAYNLCYSTFLGRIVNWRGTNKMGFTEYKRRQGLLQLLKNYINITPNGMMYTKPEIRKSLLAKMLTEILETRVMVKSGMKQDKDDKTLQQLLNNRQLALKLLANVTYGYTSASFSGRMPCSEIADSIVQTARETLERAIAYIHSVERWNAEVVYGDTDSLFIYLKGRTRDQAFDIGSEIAKAITDMNPRPVKLKFEKVYHPCVLLAKKRYVGYKYESKDQVKPEFDAKGIETVRRDGTPAEQMIEEKALKILFDTADLSQVKAYFQRQCDKIMRGRVSIQDFCFAREVKLGTYSDKGPPPAGALISTRRMLEDARAEPQYGERVPYVVITGAPGARLIDRCVAPEDLLANPHCQLDAEYYISKNLIPPLERIFNLVGANVRQWYDEMPKVQRIRRLEAPSAAGGGAGGTLGGLFGAASRGTRKKMTLESYLRSASCAVCNAKIKITNTNTNNNGFAQSTTRSNNGIVDAGDVQLCASCRRNAPASLVALQTRLAAEERRFAEVEQVCRSCASLAPLDDVPCDSKDCPVFYTRVKQAGRVRTERAIVEPLVGWLARDELEW